MVFVGLFRKFWSWLWRTALVSLQVVLLSSLNAAIFQTASSQQNSTDKFQKQVVDFIEKYNNFKSS